MRDGCITFLTGHCGPVARRYGGIIRRVCRRATARDGVSTTWEATEPVTNAVTGAVTNVPHRYVEIASGLNYLDPATGQYQPSQDLIELASDGGAAALHGPAKLYVKPNLNTAGAITLVTASNRVFQTRPLGVFWYNAQSGQAQLVAPVRDCVGELVPPNQVVFKSAFGPLADLRLVYTKSGIESDLVLLQAPTPPAGWNPQTTRLELWHEWTGAPAPAQRPRVLYQESDPTLRGQMVDPDLTDHILDFGDLWFPTGAAYATDGSDAPALNTARQVRVPNLARDASLVGVAKTWLTTPSANVLVEGVRWPDIQPKLQGLPAASAPALPLPPQDRLTWLSQLPTPSAANSPGRAITLAAGSYHPAGVVLDYLTVPSNWWGDYTFASGTTYLVTENSYFGGGTVTFQPGCIIKFAYADLVIFGGIVCNGRDWMPSILTSKDDDVYGETDYGAAGTSTHCPSYVADPAIWDYYITTNVSLIGMKIRWAQTAIEFDGSGDPYCNGYPDCCGETNSVTECSLEFCQTGIMVKRCVASIANSAMCSVATPTASEWTCQWCPTFFGSLIDACSGTDGCYGGLLPLVWEFKYFGHGCVDPNEDKDRLGGRDGLTNYGEFLAGSDPIVKNSSWGYLEGYTTYVGQPVDIILLGGSIPCNPPLAFKVVIGPQNGQLSYFPLNSNSTTYTPNPGWYGVDLFYYTVGADSGLSPVWITVLQGP